MFVVLLILFILRPLVKWIVEGGLTREPSVLEGAGLDLTVGGGEVGKSGATYTMRAPPEVDPNEVLEDIVGKDKLEELQLDKVKMKVLMEQIRTWVRENPTSTAQLLEVWLEEGPSGGE
jgi:flagellar biosynthesis/type III secretory pathway M-ring protein FliF/YscJ